LVGSASMLSAYVCIIADFHLYRDLLAPHFTDCVQ
jgi:hypothetical protein